MSRDDSQHSNHAVTGEPGPVHPRRFSRVKPILVTLFLVLFFSVLVFLAIRPRKVRDQEVMEALERTHSVPEVLVTKVTVLPSRGDLTLPGTILAISEAPIFSRSEGYLQKRFVDIGDRVSQGQLLALIEAPEVDKQVQQAQAAVARAEASLAQTQAALEQSTTQMKLAEVTAQRWNTLFAKRVVSRQEVDEKQAAYEARRADNAAMQANVNAARETVSASQADLRRLKDLKGFQEITAPFSGVITARNTDVGALIRGGASEGRELYRLARIDTVRIIVQVPQTNLAMIHTGDLASVSVQEFPNRPFKGKIVRTANALDPNTRTLPAEINIANQDFILMPGMYAQVNLAKVEMAPAVTVSGDTLMIRPDGPQVAVISEEGKVHFQKITLGRDFGPEVEVASGLNGGEMVVINPGDDVVEGELVKPRLAKKPGAAEPRPAK